MDREFYVNLARSGLRMPIGTDLILGEQEDEAAIRCDGERLGAVVVETARRFATPLAIPLMDLTLEKELALASLGIPEGEIPMYHFSAPPGPQTLAAIERGMRGPLTPRLQATVDAVRHVARFADLVACGMCIGPFSLMTKLVADPISGVYLAGAGVTGSDDPEVRTIEELLELALVVIERSVAAQIEAGAKAIVVCEPAANRVYLSPKQIAKGSDVFERMVLAPNRRIKAQLDAAGVDLFLHDCGELSDDMVRWLGSLDPALMSLGSSRKLWEDAALVPKTTVLYGNLPTKRFYAPDLTVELVEEMTCDLLAKMNDVGHPFILGSECDVLSVPGAQDEIRRKVAAFCRCDCG